MKDILIIGSNGFVGRKMLEVLKAESNNRVTATSLNVDIMPEKGYTFIQSDVCDYNRIETIFNSSKPAVVINCSAISVPDFCENNRETALKCNTQAVEWLVSLCNKYNSRLIHLSTDFVFSGNTDKLYMEDDSPEPVNFYGFTKLLAEQTIINNSDNYAIVRVAVVYGPSYPGQHNNIFMLVHQRLSANQEIKVVTDQWRTPTFVLDIVEGVRLLIEHNKNGIYHICGGECISISDIAYRVANHFNLNKELIIPATTIEMNEKTPRPKFSGLSIEKAREELGYSPVSIEQGLNLMINI